jgi:alpha-D-ribose 1-methylphosphonate 5-triphosphate diphosphatase
MRMRPLRIAGGEVLVPGGGFTTGDLCIADGRIAEGSDSAAAVLDARGLKVLPGIIDIHGDAFERQLQPRPGVEFAPAFALAETERQLLANGITTAYHGVTLSWEPGLRGIGNWRALVDALHARAWVCDMRIHLRWEAYNLDALDTALADIAGGRVHLLGFNNHTPAILRRVRDPVTAAKYSDRAGMSLEEFRALAGGVGARADEVAPALERIAEAARAAGLPMASHDDNSLAGRDAFRRNGAYICEFPQDVGVAEAAAAAGDFVVMGSPNVVRGRSQFGWASAAVMAEGGICRVLTSDYFYPCLLQAPYVLAGRGVLDLAAAWALVSANAADAAGLADRGRLLAGKRADVVLVAEVDGQPVQVATIAAGRLAWLSADGAARLGGV